MLQLKVTIIKILVTKIIIQKKDKNKIKLLQNLKLKIKPLKVKQINFLNHNNYVQYFPFLLTLFICKL